VFLIEGDDDTYIIDKGVRVEVAGDAIFEAITHSGNTLDIRGYLEGDLALHSMGTDMTVLVAASGKVRGDGGIGLDNEATVTNRGDIRVGEDGVQTGENSRIDNFGTIIADYAVNLSSGLIINHAGGSITGNEYAFIPSNPDGFDVRLVNHGSVSSPKWAYDGGNGGDTIINRGTMDGDVKLDGGGDSFDNRGGEFDGTLIGGDGDDVLMTSSKGLHMIENFGEGIDTVKSTVDYALNSNVDYLYLLGGKNLSGTGNDIINLLVGNSGDNKLSGLGGNDFLDGKGGNDRLTGGLGDEDNFIFSTGYGHDQITDFEDDVDNINIESLGAVTSFADLLDNHTRDTAKGLLIFAGKDELLVKGMTEAQLDVNDVFI
jgi:Ca2+-binding RTX toxin-like protein